MKQAKRTADSPAVVGRQSKELVTKGTGFVHRYLETGKVRTLFAGFMKQALKVIVQDCLKTDYSGVYIGGPENKAIRAGAERR